MLVSWSILGAIFCWVWGNIVASYSFAFLFFHFHLKTQAKYFSWDRLVIVLSLVFCGLFLFHLQSILQIYRTLSPSCVFCSKGSQNLQVIYGFWRWISDLEILFFKPFQVYEFFCFIFSHHLLVSFTFFDKKSAI